MKPRKRSTKAQRRRAAYDNYMGSNLALPKTAWEPVPPDRCRTINIWRRQFDYNHQHIRVLTTGRGVRFRLLN
jgi:hypothetical protein